MWSSKRGSSAPTTPCNHGFEERQVEVTRSRLKTWLRSPRIPRRLGQVDFSVREAALAVGMSPAREPPGTSPGSPFGALLTERTVDELHDHEPADATTVRREGNSARRDGATLEATVAESVDSRLQVVEEALLELNQDLLAATSQLRQLQARCDTSLVTDEKVFGGTPQLQIETRLLALEDFRGKSEAQSKELHTLCLALDQRAAGLDQDLTCVVEEVESRLKRMSEHLTTTQVEIRESLRCSPREPNSSPSSLLSLALPSKDWPTSAGEVQALQVQDKQTARKSIEELQQVLLVMQKQMSTFAAELNDAKSGAEQVQQALQQVKEKSISEADTKKFGSNTETSKQVLIDVQKQMSSFDAELKDARKGAEEMWQALQEVKWKTTSANADQTIFGMTEGLQQALTEIEKQMGSLHAELKDTKRGSEDMQQTFCEALQEMNEKITSTDADAKSVGKSTHGFHQVLTEVQKQMSSLDAEMKEARKDAEGMQQALQELNEKTIGTEKDSKIAAKSTEGLQQALTEIQQQMGSLHAELKDTKRGSEDMQQVLTEVQKQMSSLDAEMKEARKDAEGMQQALQELNEKTIGTEKDSKIAAKSTEGLQQALTEIQQQMGSLHAELKDTKRGSEDMQKDLQVVREMTSCTDADAKTIAKRTEKMDQALKDIQDKTSFTDADAKSRAKNTEELHQVLGDVQKRMSLFDAELKDARKLTEKMQQDLAEAQSKERSLAQVPPPAKENEAVADLKAVVENLQQEFRGASLRAEVGELQRHMSQLQQAMVEVQGRSGQGQDALRGGLDELVQVVEAVRHALCESESEVNELRKASEHCQEVLGATASHGQLEELQKRLVDMEKAMEMNTAKVEEAYQGMSRGPERRIIAPSSQGVEDSESGAPRAQAASIDVAEREVLRSSFDESLEEVKAELKLVSFEALSSIEENRCFTAQSCEELHAEVQSLAQRCTEEFQAAKEIQGLRGAVTESASEALILNFPEASWPPPEAFEETLRSKLKLDPTMQIRLQQRQPGLAAEVQGSSQRLQELQRNWASAEMGELSDDLKVCLALRGSASETASTDALWIDSLLQTFKREVMEDRKECCEEVAEVKAFLLAEQQKQGQQLRELRKSQEGIQESVGAVAKEWCAGLSELRVALTQDVDSSQRQEESLALQRAGVQESLVQLQGAVSMELGEARRHISEFMEEEAARLQAQSFAELLEASKSQAGELDLVRRQLIETVQDRVDLRRQLLDVCRSSQFAESAQRSQFEQETQTQRVQLQRRP